MEQMVVATRSGPVELAVEHPERPVLLVLPGGHCSATTDVGWDLLRATGHGMVSVSRPGYGATAVGARTAAEFVEPLSEALQRVGVTRVAAAIGVSFGGLQAVELARRGEPRPESLILASAAPSTRPYPDTRKEMLVGPLAFGPRMQRVTWALVRRLVSTDAGLKMMAASLSRLPVGDWWDSWSAEDKEAARRLFSSMDSGSGFVNDLRQARPGGSQERRAALADVAVPTLVLGSVNDASVSFAHAEDEAATIPQAQLVQTDAESHLYWLGGRRDDIRQAVQDFLATGDDQGTR